MVRCKKVVKAKKSATKLSKADSSSGSELAEGREYAVNGEGANPDSVILGPFLTEKDKAFRGLENKLPKAGLDGEFTRALVQYATCLKLLLGFFGLGMYVASGIEVGKLGFFLWYNPGPKSATMVYGEYIFEILMALILLGLMAQDTFGFLTEFLLHLWLMATALVLLTSLFLSPGLHRCNYPDLGMLLNMRMFLSDPTNWMLFAAWMNLNQLLGFVAYLLGQDYATRRAMYNKTSN